MERKPTRQQSSKAELQTIALISASFGLAAQLVSVFGSSDRLGLELLLNCGRKDYPRRQDTTFGLNYEVLNMPWCLLTNFVKGFCETPLSIGIFLLVMSIALQVWVYFSVVSNMRNTSKWTHPVTTSLLMFFSQVVGFQGILAVLWVPLYALKSNILPISRETRTRSNASVRTKCAVIGHILLGSVIFMANTDGPAYRFAQIPFQFYVLALPISFLLVPNGKGKANATESIDQAIRSFGRLSGVMWWIGILICFLRPQSPIVSSKKQIWSPVISSYVLSFPHWKPASREEFFWQNLSAGQVFSIFDIIVMLLSLYFIAKIDSIKRQQKHPTLIRTALLRYGLGGPGYAWSIYFAEQIAHE